MTNETIDELIEGLWSNDSENAIRSIKAIGESALPALLIALKKDDRNAEFVDFENGALRQAIIDIGEPAFQKLVEALTPGSDLVRAAAKTLKRWGDSRAVDYLIAAMQNDAIDTNGRCYIIDALGYFRDPKSFEPLIITLRHQNEYIKCHAARSLAEYGDVSVMALIFDALEGVNRKWWYGTSESIGEIVKLLQKKAIQSGKEEDFETCLNKIRDNHLEMVEEYEAWNHIG